MSNRFNFRTLTSNNCKATEANILIHGYSAGHNSKDKKELAESIPDAVSHYTNIFAFWPSSHFTRVNKKSRALIGASTRAHWSAGAVTFTGDRIAHFWQIRSRAEDMGKELFNQLNDYLRTHHPEITTINLIGHSLGGRLIVSSLKTLVNTENYSFTINDVLLMAAAVKVEPSEAQQIRAQVKGRLINAYSKSDWTLLMNADETCLGRNEVEHFENIQIANFGHSDYWKKLPEVLAFTQFKPPFRSLPPQEDISEAAVKANLSAHQLVEKIMPFELNTPNDIYQRINEELFEVLSSLTIQSNDNTLKQAQNDALTLLRQHQKNLKNELDELEKNAEWNTFTIAFYGETGAGKSTIIETLRILLQEPTKLASQKKFRELHNQYTSSKKNFQQIQQVIEQTETRLADISQQLSAIQQNQEQLHNDTLRAISQLNIQHGELTQELSSTLKRRDQLYNDTLSTTTKLQALISEQKKSAPLWQKLLNLFRKTSEEAELIRVQQQLPEIETARDHASAMLRAQKNNTEKNIFTLKQKLPVIALEHDKISSLLLAQQAEKKQIIHTLKQQSQANKNRLTELSAELQKQADGEIIGDGRSDFTRQTQRYDLQLDGQPFALLDVPGIEGAEELVSDQVKLAVQTAHAVFYVTNSAAPPQTGDGQRKGTLDKIKENLGSQTEVWTVFNKKITNTKALNRSTLTSDDEQAGLVALDKKMYEQLGIHYRQVFPLTALPAFLASTDHFIENSLNANRRNKMLKDLDAKTLLEKSQLRDFLQLLSNRLLFGSQAKISRANFNKANVALNQVADTLGSIQYSFTELSEKLKLDGESAQVQLIGSLNALKRRLEATSQRQIDQFASKVRNAMYELIERDVSNDDFKEGLSGCICEEQKRLSTQLDDAVSKDLRRFESDAENIIKRFEDHTRELAAIYAKLGNTKLENNFKLNLDIDNGIKIGSLLITLAGAIAAIIGSGGWLLALGLVGLVFSFTKSVRGFFDTDYKKAQQKKSVETNLTNITEKIGIALQSSFESALPEINKKTKQLEQALETPGKQTASTAQLLGQSIRKLHSISKQIDHAGKLS